MLGVPLRPKTESLVGLLVPCRGDLTAFLRDTRRWLEEHAPPSMVGEKHRHVAKTPERWAGATDTASRSLLYSVMPSSRSASGVARPATVPAGCRYHPGSS